MLFHCETEMNACLIKAELHLHCSYSLRLHYEYLHWSHRTSGTLLTVTYHCVQVDCIVTTAGGVEEDFIKCLAPTYVGDFHLSGRELRDRGINRIGNLLAPNDNYCKFEDWIMPILDKMVSEQREQVRSTSDCVLLMITHTTNSNCLRQSRLQCRCTNFMEQSAC